MVPGYTLIVTGARREGTDGWVRIVDGDLLEVSLRRSEELSTSSPASSSTGTDNEEEEDDEDNLPGSSDFSDSGPPDGNGPFGPPPENCEFRDGQRTHP